MIRKALLISALFALGTVAADAIPAYPAKRIYTKADGTQVTLTLKGDEHFSFYTDEQNTAYVRSEKGLLRPMSMREASKMWEDRIGQDALLRQRTASRSRRLTRVGEAKPSLTGKKKGVVILMDFPDVKFSHDNIQAIYKDFFNLQGYSNYGMSGSVRDYFLAQSYGKLDIEFDVVGPYTTYYSMGYYGKPSEYSNDSNPNEMVFEACKAADADVNFADYDWDGDGEVDQVFVIYAGYGQNYGADENTIWPHEWSMSAANRKMTLDNTKIDTYACSCELRGVRGTSIDGIGAACHEFSHCLGLPDFYDTSGSSSNYGLGTWDVMCSGSYNDNSCTPAGYTAYERMFAGWLTPVELNSMTRVVDMKPLAEEPEAYIMYNEGNKNEYYLLENRQPVKFDKELPGHGLLVVHVDYSPEAWGSNSVNVSTSRQRMTIIPADNLASRYGESGDPFPGTRGVTALTNYTTPAATLYNENADGTKLMGKPIDNISENVENHTVSFVACRPELAIPVPGNGEEKADGKSFSVTWPAVSGAVGYELELTSIGKAAQDPKNALQYEFTFDSFISKSNGLSDVSGKMATYGLSGWSGSKIYTSPSKLRLGTSSSAGNVRTATWKVPDSQDVTIVMGANVVKAGTPVKGTLRMSYGNNGETATNETADFEVTDAQRLVFHFTVRKDLFYITIMPESQMYLDYLAIYDGTWTEEQLGINNANAVRTMAPKRASTVTTFTTSDNSYTFEGLSFNNRYIYRVRAIGDENTYSLWSEEKTFEFSSASVNDLKLNTHEGSSALYDLQGRKVKSPGKGIYIRNGRKVIY